MDQYINRLRVRLRAALGTRMPKDAAGSRLWLKPPVLFAGAAIAVLAVLAVMTIRANRVLPVAQAEAADQGRRSGNVYYPSDAQWKTLTVEPVGRQVFHSRHSTEGKIAVDEDRSTLVFSPYSGRIIKLMAKPGDEVKAGQPLFIVETADMVQAQNDYINAASVLNKTRAALEFAEIVERQNKSLFETRAGPLRDLQQAQAATSAAKNDVRAAETALEMVRNRLRILGNSDDEIVKFGETGIVNPATIIFSPISGTVIQRRVGPGQYVNPASNNNNANDATFVVGDLSTVWLIAYVRESEAPNIHVGQALNFTVLAYPNRVFTANINYVATSLDASTRRLQVRATINNSQLVFKPEMFASVTILTSEGDASPTVPRDSIIYEGNTARIWVIRDDKAIERRAITVGLSDGRMVQVIDGLKGNEKIIVAGSLFIDRAATGN